MATHAKYLKVAWVVVVMIEVFVVYREILTASANIALFFLDFASVAPLILATFPCPMIWAAYLGNLASARLICQLVSF